MTFIDKLMQNSPRGYEKVLGDQLRKEPALLVSDMHGAHANVIHHKAAYPVVRNQVFFLMKGSNDTYSIVILE